MPNDVQSAIDKVIEAVSKASAPKPPTPPVDQSKPQPTGSAGYPKSGS